MNINPSDGHNLGYGSPLWGNTKSIGSEDKAFSKDFKSQAAWEEDANYIAIARHQNGICDAVKVWKFKKHGSMYSKLKNTNPGRFIATTGGTVYSSIPVSLANKATDPIFGSTGDLAFNWWYSNNGARIAVDGVGKNGNPGVRLSCSNCNTDDVHGLGNEFGANTQSGKGSGQWWHDVANLGPDCHGGSCVVQGTDHGTSLKNGKVFGQYAIYVVTSDSLPKFPCQGRRLDTQVPVPTGMNHFAIKSTFCT